MPDNALHFDVTTADFQEKVLDASRQAVVVVDFWAEWCGPCRMLGPVLENVVDSFSGRVLLAKVNVDQNPDLARMFSVQSIPAVHIIKGGEVVDQFMGAIPEPQIRAILEPLAGSDAADALELANRMLADGRAEEADALYDEILAASPDASPAIIGKARAAIDRKKFGEAHKLLSGIDALDSMHDEADALLRGIEFHKLCAESGDIAGLSRRAAENPGDLDALYSLGCCHAANGRYEDALESFLRVVSRNAAYDGGKAREAMLAIFTLLGPESEITHTWRKKLAQVLF